MTMLLKVQAPPDQFQPPPPYPLITAAGTFVADGDVAAIVAAARASGVILVATSGDSPAPDPSGQVVTRAYGDQNYAAKPTNAGTAGQVITKQSDGSSAWATPSGGGGLTVVDL